MKIRCVVVAIILTMMTVALPRHDAAVAASCPELKVIFARGSGGARWTDQNYLAFSEALRDKLAATSISYEFEDLDYPAIDIGNITTLLGAFFGGGEAYDFGKSVNAGVERLAANVNGRCPNTKYVVAGYSQGAMVVSKSLHRLDADKVIYSATFGDPKIYLPEGAGAMPPACLGQGLSDYRMYVPDCRAFIGKLGTYLPYQPESFVGKMGTWCNRMDIFCSSYLSIASHVSYVSDNLYEDAARVIFDRVAKVFNIENHDVAPHDTVILIDVTGSMGPLIDRYKNEAKKLARQTLATNGRVALYKYTDFQEENAVVMLCDFGCTLEEVEAKLDGLVLGDGGDINESALGASFAAMNELTWQKGAVKSLVILTDAAYHNPDFDAQRTTLADVVKLSREIDPVNIYVVTTPLVAESYQELTTATGGAVATSVDDFELMTEEILARVDALPRVEEWVDDGEELPWAEIVSVEQNMTAATIRLQSSHGRFMVALNDAILGVVEGEEFTIEELAPGTENILTVIPISENRSGIPIEIPLEKITAPLAPDTGRL